MPPPKGRRQMRHEKMQKRIWNTKLDSNSSSALEELGIERTEYDSTNRLRTFRYVQAAADTTVRRGTVLGYTDTKKVTVSSDITDFNQNQPAGVGHAAITAEYYGWIECKGYHEYVHTDGSDTFADGDTITVHGTTDGVAGRIPSGVAAYYKPLGVAVGDDDNVQNVVTVQLDC
jgi:hypothetical protein